MRCKIVLTLQHYNDVDLFCITVWSVIAKVMCKELRRLALLKDTEGKSRFSPWISIFAE